jgi:HEAT repeat protein
MPLFGPPDVAKLKAKGDVPGLIKALGYEKDSNVGRAAARALGEIGDPRAVGPLVTALKGQDADVHRLAAEALGRIGDARAVEPLVAALGDQAMRRSAAVALAEIGAPAVEGLVAALNHSAKEVLDQLRRQGADRSMINAVTNANVDMREAAAEALGKIGDARAVEPLITALDSEYVSLSKAAAEALGKIGDARAVEPLTIARKSGLSGVSGAAAAALEKMNLGMIGDAADAHDITPLVAALSDQSGEVRKATAAALVQIGIPAVEPVIASLKDANGWGRSAAAEALGEIGDTRAVEPLIAALQDEDKGVRRAGVEALGKVGDARAVEPLITFTAVQQDQDQGVRKAGVEALGKVGDARAVEPLIAALRDHDSDVAKAAAGALVNIGAPAVEPLIAALNREDLRGAAARALGQIGNARAVEPLTAALKDWGSAGWRHGGYWAVAEALDRLAWSPDSGEAGAAYWAVKGKWDKCVQIGAPAVEPLPEPLIAALTDENKDVRKEAAEGLVTIYRSGKLDKAQAAKVLAQRGVITQAHYDDSSCGSHGDAGVGVAFPV